MRRGVKAVRGRTPNGLSLGALMTSQAATRRQGGLAEAEVEERLAAFLDSTGLFRVFRQMMGRALWRPCPAAGRVRADVLVLASRGGLQAGWRAGPILFEVKRPGRPIGPGLCQLMDYLACAWRLPNGIEILPAFGFLFPADKQHGALASVMAQNRVGTCRLRGDELTLWCGEQRIVTVGTPGPGHGDGTLRVGQVCVGAKFGAR